MACGCASKNKNSAPVARTHSVEFAPRRLAEGQTDESVLEHTSFRRVRYLVLTREEATSSDPQAAETYNVLAEAQKRVRDLGSGYVIKATRKI